MKSSLKPGSIETPPQGSTALATQPAGTLAIPQDKYDYDNDGSRDVLTPVLGLVNSTGPLAKKFRGDYGKFCYAERVILGETVSVIALRLEKFYVESRRNGVELKYDEDKQFFGTAAAAHAAGYAVDFDSNHPNKVDEASRVLLLVAGPADDPSGDFFVNLAGLSFAPAQMTLRRGGHRDVYRKLNTAATRAPLRGGVIHDQLWLLSREEREKGENAWVEPRIEIKAKLVPEDVAKLNEVIPAILGRPATKTSE
jgi:hypothetical protein